MTTPETFARISNAPEPFVFPDPPEDPEDKMTSFDRLTINGNAHYLAQHLGNPETTLVAGDRYLALAPTRDLAGVRYPDLLVAFDVDPAAYRRSNAYVISEQGKPPDLVLEIASRSTGRIDVTDKRRDYAALGIGEYWRFDETGLYHGTRLAGDRLVDGEYAPWTSRNSPTAACRDTAPPWTCASAGRMASWSSTTRPQAAPSPPWPMNAPAPPPPKPNSALNGKPAPPPRPASASWKNKSAARTPTRRATPRMRITLLTGCPAAATVTR